MKTTVNIQPRSLLIIVVLVLFFSKSFSQPTNLVNNSSFEDTLNCLISPPYTIADGWEMIYGTPDYFNEVMSSCSFANNGFNNFWADGYQLSHSGNAYMGFAPYCPPANCGSNYREAIQTLLSDTLVINKTYCVSFYVNLANKAKRATDDIGCYFSSTNSIPFPAPAQIYNTQGNLIIDTTNWTLISKLYTATGNELYMNIGNFKNDASTTVFISNPSATDEESYYFIDDVSVYELPEIDAGINDSINTGGSIQLNATCSTCWPGLQYHWYPATGLNDTTILNPNASPTATTTYYFGLIDTTGTIPCMVDYIDSVTIYVTGIEENNFGNQINIFPNPNNGNFSINFSQTGNYLIEITNGIGQKIYEEKITSKFYMVNTTFNSGVYFLKIFDLRSNKTVFKKLVIQSISN